jgi:hypothetical protein|tara:strand:- start:305 stop:1153 length:849 start_codon:yes stop_codon:yes gene_type:complete
MSVTPELLALSQKDLDIEEIQEHLHRHYDDIEDLISGVAENQFHLIINGSPGMGKTEFTKDVLKKYVKGHNDIPPIPRPNFLSGTASGIKMFVELQKAKDEGQITVVDDTDKILEDTECLDLLKGCLDSQGEKVVDWKKYSTAIKNEDVKEKFVYNGRLIIITNKKIKTIQDDTANVSRLKLDPIMSRCQYIRAGLPNNKFKIQALRMFHDGYKKQSRYNLRCFKDSNVPEDVQEQMMDFLDENQDRFSELSFRTVAKLCDLWKFKPNKWDRLAKTSMFSQY